MNKVVKKIFYIYPDHVTEKGKGTGSPRYDMPKYEFTRERLFRPCLRGQG